MFIVFRLEVFVSDAFNGFCFFVKPFVSAFGNPADHHKVRLFTLIFYGKASQTESRTQNFKMSIYFFASLAVLIPEILDLLIKLSKLVFKLGLFNREFSDDLFGSSLIKRNSYPLKIKRSKNSVRRADFRPRSRIYAPMPFFIRRARNKQKIFRIFISEQF